ncbi:MAG: hypothetical protein FWG71_00515 [Synergistaceae bacterium]|nr:hypothetical protein [Synergistaceae bacterium]
MEDGLLGDIFAACCREWPQTTAVTGALGSGKTEFVLNLAGGLKKIGRRVVIADADIINPYFCIRQITKSLEQEGFTILTPPKNAKWSDMSVINAAIGNTIAGVSSGLYDHLILDVGGGAGGVKALKQFEPDILSVSHQLILTVNAYRPKTSTPDGIKRMAAQMEALCGIKIGALVSNSHVMEPTTAADVARGLDVVLEAGKSMNLPVLCATVVPGLYEETRALLKDIVPVWPLVRFMKRPWEGSEIWS